MQSFNREDYIHKLEKENSELQQKWLDESYARTLQTIQLNKAKEIIEELISQNRKLWVYSDIREKTEQFLKENK